MRLQTQITLISVAMLIMSISIFINILQDKIRYKRQSKKLANIISVIENQKKIDMLIVKNLQQKQILINLLYKKIKD